MREEIILTDQNRTQSQSRAECGPLTNHMPNVYLLIAKQCVARSRSAWHNHAARACVIVQQNLNYLAQLICRMLILEPGLSRLSVS